MKYILRKEKKTAEKTNKLLDKNFDNKNYGIYTMVDKKIYKLKCVNQ
jgi:hypothetical protein